MRTTVVLAALVLSGMSGAANAAPVTPSQAEALGGAFRARYGGGVLVRFRADRAGASFLGRFLSEPLGGDPVAAAWRFIERESAILGVADPRGSLRVERTVPLGRWTAVRFRQTAGGLPVIGRGLVVVAGGDGRVCQAAGGLAGVGAIAGGFALSASEAAAALRAAAPGAVVESVEPAVFAHGDGARFVHVAVVETGGPLDRFEVVQDASTGRPLFARRLFVSARGHIYDPNPEVAPAHVEVDLPRLTSTTALDGELATAWACSDSRCRTLVRRALPDVDGDYLYPPLEGATDDAFAEVNAYFHIDRVNRFFEETLGFTWLCGTSRAMRVAVNMPVANAFYGDINRDRCGDVVLGQGSVVDFAYDADVIYHEFGHGVIDDVAGLIGWTADELGPDFSSGGLNEGTADYFSVTITGDPTLGEYAAREGTIGGEMAIRSADNTATCPQGLSGQSHMDGRIWSGTTWEIRTAIGAPKTDRLVFDALASLSDVADFDEAGRALISQASRLVGDGILTAADAAHVERIAVERGLVGCERIIDLGLGNAAAFSMGLDELGGMLSRMYAGVQFKIEAPADATRVQLTTSPFTVMPSGAYEVYMRKNQPIHFTVSGWSITLDGYDHRYTGSPAAPTPWRILLAPWTDPPLEPGTTYHFTFMHTNPNAVYMSLEGIVIRSPPPEDGGDGGEDASDEAGGEDAEASGDDDAGADPDADEADEAEASGDDDAGADAPEDDVAADGQGLSASGSGCGCRTSGRSSGRGAFPAILLLLAVLRRRRSVRPPGIS